MGPHTEYTATPLGDLLAERAGLRAAIKVQRWAHGKDIKTVLVKVFEPGNKICRTRRCAALKGQRWTGHGIQQLLEFIASEIEQAMPLEEYELIELGPAAFNFVHRGTRRPKGCTCDVRYHAPDCALCPLPAEQPQLTEVSV